MKLDPKEADLYFDLMWSVQWYVSQTYNILDSVESPAIYKDLPLDDKLEVREYLFKNIQDVVDGLTESNPLKLDEEKLALLRSWKECVSGDFFIERILKRYTVVIHQQTEEVYGILGLYEDFEEIIPKAALPLYVKLHLLPFKDRIIYDGLMQSYAVSFGSGYKRDLHHIYMQAKENNWIILQLGQESPKQTTRKSIATPDWTPEINELITQAKKLRGGKGQPRVYSSVFSLVKLSLELAQKATSGERDVDEYYKKLARADRLIRQIEREVDFLD